MNHKSHFYQRRSRTLDRTPLNWYYAFKFRSCTVYAYEKPQDPLQRRPPAPNIAQASLRWRSDQPYQIHFRVAAALYLFADVSETPFLIFAAQHREAHLRWSAASSHRASYVDALWKRSIHLAWSAALQVAQSLADVCKRTRGLREYGCLIEGVMLEIDDQAFEKVPSPSPL
jgi:hypothetical protein